MLRDFISQLADAMQVVNSRLQRDLTMKDRVEKKYSIRDAAQLFGVSGNYMTDMVARYTDEEPDWPHGEREGRKRVFSLQDLLLMRAILDSKSTAKKRYLHWRQPGDPLPVVTFGAQKGGTGKSLSAAHFAQYLSLNYGLRVGLIDCDPQATLSLYFADRNLRLFDEDTPTVATFMGVDAPGNNDIYRHSTDQMDAMWQPTPWPGIRLLPGGASIQNGDISLFLMAREIREPVYLIMKRAIQKWDDAYGPRTKLADLRDDNGRFYIDRYKAALEETFDVLVIDQQPSLTLMQLNGLVAATSTVIPQTMKGFDLATLTTYSESVRDYMDFIANRTGGDEVGLGKHAVLPSIISESNDRDMEQLVDLYDHAPELIMQTWYTRSDAIANAAEEYKSIYEYQPPKSRARSAAAFVENANAVNDQLTELTMPHLPSQGYARAFIKEKWGE